MAAVTISSEFGAPKNEVCVSIVSPSICHEVMGLDATPPTLHQATANPCLCWRLLDAQGKPGPVSCGHCSFLLGPRVHSSVCALPESVSSVLCKFW